MRSSVPNFPPAPVAPLPDDPMLFHSMDTLSLARRLQGSISQRRLQKPDDSQWATKLERALIGFIVEQELAIEEKRQPEVRHG